MVEVSKKQNIFLAWLSWQFFEVPLAILKGWRNFLLFGLNYFSVSLLLKTLFSPWKRYSVSYGRGFDIGRYSSALLSNLIFRLLGAIMRSFLILIGLLAEVLIVFLGLAVFFIWLFLPVIFFWGLIFGFKILL